MTLLDMCLFSNELLMLSVVFAQFHNCKEICLSVSCATVSDISMNQVKSTKLKCSVVNSSLSGQCLKICLDLVDAC